ncbi:5-bromo-4-chloroindolyl phosphate hydrolysis family protein [Enterovibrio norvegicus]|uniref:hypothetical protein n=1 Tax=Enterovibrio norvegicus TaxID=188144 RepID=UPI003D0A2A57
MNRIKYVIVIFFLALLVGPIVIYSSVFGLGVWPRHDEWAQMGSAIGGIYAPIVGIMTLFVLYMQLKFQMLIHDKSESDRKIENLVSEAKESIRRLDKRLNQTLEEVIDDEKIHMALAQVNSNSIDYKSIKELLEKKHIREMKVKTFLFAMLKSNTTTDKYYPFWSVVAYLLAGPINVSWLGVVLIIDELFNRAENSNENKIALEFKTAHLKLINTSAEMLNFEVCMNLDELLKKSHQDTGRTPPINYFSTSASV